jgi:hypothetical protein
MLHSDTWLVSQLADMRIREALRQAETRRQLHQARRVREDWPWRQVHHLGRHLGYFLIELGVGLIERTLLLPPLSDTGQAGADACCGASL